MTIFIENKYSRWYFKIIDNRKSNILIEAYEEHHIIPKSLGGSNDDCNLVRLSLREHYICHLLLIKMTSGMQKSKMAFAFVAMKARTNMNSKHYALARKSLKHTDATKKILREKALGRKYSEEAKQNMANSHIGSKRSLETRQRQSEAAKKRWAKQKAIFCDNVTNSSTFLV